LWAARNPLFMIGKKVNSKTDSGGKRGGTQETNPGLREPKKRGLYEKGARGF